MHQPQQQHPELRPLDPYPDRKHRTACQSVARGLGWFSIALGAAEVLFAPSFARGLGMPGRAWLIRAYGMREIATGLGILGAKRDMTPWLWGRVAGDALDIGTLAAHAGADNPRHGACVAAIGAVAGVTVIDLSAAQASQSRRAQAHMALHDYSDRSGLPQGVEATRGIARRDDFEVPRDMRQPQRCGRIRCTERRRDGRRAGDPQRLRRSSASSRTARGCWCASEPAALRVMMC